MKLLFIRHGEPDYTVDSLTPKGFREAELLADRLEKETIRDFYISPLGRAQDTARVTLTRLSREGETLPWLREFPARVANPMWPTMSLPWDWMPLYWTEQPELYDRDGWRDNAIIKTGDVEKVYDEVTGSLDALIERYGYVRERGHYRVVGGGCADTIAFFCHFGITIVMLSHLLGISPTLGWQSFFFAPASITTVVTEERMEGAAAFRCIGAGDVSHLTDFGEPMSRSGLFRERFGDKD